MRMSFIGAGNLAEAMIYALVDKLNIRDISVMDKNEGQYERYAGLALDYIYNYDLRAALSGDIIFLLVKPGDFAGLLQDIKNLGIDLGGKIFVSTAAGVSMGYIREQIGQDIKIVRVMPNTPVFCGRGMTALCSNAGSADFERVCEIFRAMGEIITLPEERMNDIIAVNGSSPAYIYLFAEAMLEGAAELGFDRREIYPVILQSLAGALDMLISSGKTPGELIRAVASPGGTTERALESFRADDFTGTVRKAMRECAARAEQIARGFAPNNAVNLGN